MQPTSSALITSDAVILSLLMATLGLVFYTSSHSHPKLRAFYKYVPSLLRCYFISTRKFKRPAQLACYLGPVSKEDSSGDRTRLGSITKAGNSHCRHVLVQAAWSYRHRPQTSVDLKRRQQGQPPSVITHARKAQQRLYQRFNHLSYRKRPQIAAVAVARELVGFLWSVMQDVAAQEPRAA